MPEELIKEKQLAIVGEEDIVLGFQAMGFKVYPIKKTQDIKPALEAIVAANLAVCLIQEEIYSLEEPMINSYKKLPLPVFVPFAKNGQTKVLDKIIKGIKIRATGRF